MKFLASDFGLTPGTGEDMTPVFRGIVESGRLQRGSVLLFEPGIYDFWPDRAFEKYLFISNNDEGLKRIGFPLISCEELKIDGRGAKFVFRGPMIPFFLENSRRIVLRNLSFDFSRTFHSEGVVTRVAPDSIDLEIADDFPFEIRNGVLVFLGETGFRGPATTVRSGEIIYPYGSLLAFDPVRRETSFMASDKYHLESGVAAEMLGRDKIRIFATKISARVGDVIVFGSGQRAFPGIVVSDCSDVFLESVAINHCGGMGVIVQRSANISLANVKVTPSAGRMISSTADATHFTNCRGTIALRDCTFENQMDDAANFHGLYAQISRVLSPCSFEARLVHSQQAGVEFIQKGMRLELTRAKCLRTIGEMSVDSVERLNKEFCVVTTEKPLPADLQEGDVVADAEANTAEVLIQNCILRGNRARGVLLGSRGKIVLEGNYFHVPGAAILFEGDACHWFEQAGVREVVIRKNIFDNCNFGVWGEAAIEVRSGIAKDVRKASRYNRNIVIEDNFFRTFGGNPLVNAYSVGGMVIRRNDIEETGDYPVARKVDYGRILVSDSDAVAVENPRTVPSAGRSPSTNSNGSSSDSRQNRNDDGAGSNVWNLWKNRHMQTSKEAQS